MVVPQRSELIYDWNRIPGSMPLREKPVHFDDETLRDGLQSPSVATPTIGEKIEILHLMAALGIDAANIGLPGAGAAVERDVAALACEIVASKLAIFPNCAARTVEADIEPIVRVSQKAGIPIEAATFIGSSPIRQYTEDWDLDRMLRSTESAVRFAVKNDLPVMYVTEDTTRAHPDTLRRLYTTAIECGARAVCICDTVGHIAPWGVKAVVQFVRQVVAESGQPVRIDWHGHRDRGLDVANTLAAIFAGVDRVHGAALGVGERVGNTPMDLLLVNLRLMGFIANDLTRLGEYCELVSRACKVPIPFNYPVVGSDAFRTATGVHAAAVIKAMKKEQDGWLADQIYSGVPASLFGLRQRIEIGPMSGRSNVVFWLEGHGYEASEERVKRIFAAAKASSTLLEDAEIDRLARES
jgi:2-isopropylmalate synthase